MWVSHDIPHFLLYLLIPKNIIPIYTIVHRSTTHLNQFSVTLNQVAYFFVGFIPTTKTTFRCFHIQNTHTHTHTHTHNRRISPRAPLPWIIFGLRCGFWTWNLPQNWINITRNDYTCWARKFALRFYAQRWYDPMLMLGTRLDFGYIFSSG